MQRHRNLANGFRSSPIGIGGGGGGVGGVAAGGLGYRNFSRGGYGRGQPPPPRRIDVFMEAGKLATEYLVAKGLLPPNSVNGKWQNSNLKNQIGGGDGGRRFTDEYSSATGSRDGIRVRRTPLGSFKNPGFELNPEINRSSSIKQGDGDSISGSMEEQRSGKDDVNEEQKSVSSDLESKSNDAGNIKTTIVNQQNQSADEKTSIKTPISDVSDGSKNAIANTNTDDIVMDDGNQESEKPIVKEEDPPVENNSNIANNNSSDLLTLIRFNKVPTRTRSSVSLKGSKSDPVLIAEDENKNKDQNSGEPGNSNSLQDDENQELKSLNHEPKIRLGPCTRSQSFPLRSSIFEQELSEENHGFTRSSSTISARGEKRPLQLDDSAEVSKKPRDWASANPQSDGGSRITQLCNSDIEEKQFFPSSSKICDLNSMEVSDVNDNKYDTNSVIGFSSVKQVKHEPPVSVDFDLSMNSSCDLADRHVRRGADGKEVEVIDLDCDSMQDEKVYSNSDRREEAIFTDLESFPDSMQRVSDMPQDGYGLMISELLEADIPNSTVSTGVNSMHNDMNLQNEEGMLNDDESIYMSLGEIPISFVPVWDQQPSQGYDKRY